MKAEPLGATEDQGLVDWLTAQTQMLVCVCDNVRLINVPTWNSWSINCLVNWQKIHYLHFDFQYFIFLQKMQWLNVLNVNILRYF